MSRIHHLDGDARKHMLAREKQERNGVPFESRNVQAQKASRTANDCTNFKLVHPFTALVAGMTGSGKTVWVKSLLENADKTISPPPQRIIWCYAQWQPAYEKLMNSLPGIEFVKGIPDDLEEDWYLNETVNNLIVVDDQMAEASSDKRILNLFTKGSHHRNLSVIFLLQNLFHQGKISRTVSLNSHYLVLFKNPRDKMQVLTLAKQVYPGGTQTFMRKYEEAVHRPYGYLLVDLKPNTPDRCRLKTNVLPGDPVSDRTERVRTGNEAIADLLRRESYTQPPLVKQMSGLEKQMDEILKQPDMADDIKAQLYNQRLQRFLNFQHQFRDSLPYMNGSAPSQIHHEEKPPIPTTPVPTVSLPIPPIQAEQTPSMGTPFSPLELKERRTQPPRKRKKPEWISYTKGSPRDKGPYARQRKKQEGSQKLKLIKQTPENWIEYTAM